jgi:ribosomal protein S18 acetylase RimI-like enzyme
MNTDSGSISITQRRARAKVEDFNDAQADAFAERMLNTLNIRPLIQTNEPFLWEMLYHAIYLPAGHDPFPKEIVTEPEIAKYVLNWGKTDDKGFVAVDGVTVKPVGAVWLRLFTRENKGYGYVDDNTPELSIALLPEYRNRGIGTDLLNRLIEDIQDQYPAISLSVSSANPAGRLYRRLGFDIIEENGASLTMKKTLGRADKENIPQPPDQALPIGN